MSGLGIAGVGLTGAFAVPASAGTPATEPGYPTVDGYGPLSAAGPDLALPAGFSDRAFGRAGELMSDGLPTPGCRDGQALFPAGHDRVRLIRNHELDLDIPKIKQQALTTALAYDRAGPAGFRSVPRSRGTAACPHACRGSFDGSGRARSPAMRLSVVARTAGVTAETSITFASGTVDVWAVSDHFKRVGDRFVVTARVH